MQTLVLGCLGTNIKGQIIHLNISKRQGSLVHFMRSRQGALVRQRQLCEPRWRKDTQVGLQKCSVPAVQVLGHKPRRLVRSARTLRMPGYMLALAHESTDKLKLIQDVVSTGWEEGMSSYQRQVVTAPLLAGITEGQG